MKNKITKISVTNQKISGRGGITFFLRYIEKSNFYQLIEQIFSKLQIFNSKGLQLLQFIEQMLAFFIDGTDMSISSFDRKKTDTSYASLLENTPKEMASSHQIKRFIRKLSILPNIIFRKILRSLFIWRLKIEHPKVIKLWIDTMVMDNDDAEKREGCEPTYKKVKGFQPLHVKWNNFLIDVIFRKGNAHSNHGTDYIDIVRDIVKLIRKKYNASVPIIVNNDSGFFDQKAFNYFEDELKIHYVTSGKFYDDIKEYIVGIKEANAKLKKGNQIGLFKEYSNKNNIWGYIEFGNKLKSWTKFRRCIYTELQTNENGQYLLYFHKSDNLIYTNIGINPELDNKLKGTEAEKYFSAEELISFSHSKGSDELIHRSLKEFATKEQLPFKKFGMNQVYYYLLVIAHFLFETYKIDITYDVVPIKSYPNTFRRKLIDFAVKIVTHSHKITMQVVSTVYNILKICEIWKRCQSPPQMLLAESIV